jgi:flagellar transcriptional activator FlhD
MSNDQISNDIRDANLSFLMLAQNAIRRDKAQALIGFGIADESAELIARLSPAQMLNIATSPVLLCRMRVDDEMVWGLLTSHTTPRSDVAGSTLLRTRPQFSQRFATLA